MKVFKGGIFSLIKTGLWDCDVNQISFKTAAEHQGNQW